MLNVSLAKEKLDNFMKKLKIKDKFILFCPVMVFRFFHLNFCSLLVNVFKF